MDNGEDATKVAAVCTSCKRAFAAEVLSDGAIRLIGQPSGCRCGGTELALPNETRRLEGEGRERPERE